MSQNVYDRTLDTLESIKKKLDKIRNQLPKLKVLLGFDGYVDYLYSLVQMRENVSEWNKFESMKTVGELLTKVAGSSLGLECVLKRITAGGFTSNTSKALVALGINVNLLASFGYPKILPVFQDLCSKKEIDLNSINDPGETVGLEFDDGKVMITDYENIYNLNWNLILERIGLESLIKKWESANGIGIGYWSSVPEMDAIWIKLLEEVIPSISHKGSKIFFVDLADIKKRSKNNIQKMLRTLKLINNEIPVVLSLNDQEAIDIIKALDLKDLKPPTQIDSNIFHTLGLSLNNHLELSHLIIHSPHFATFTDLQLENHCLITQAFTSKPRFTTSAGDHFNGGLLAGLTCGLTPEETLLMGNIITSIFIRTGKSPDFNEFKHFTSQYTEYLNSDKPLFP